MFFRRVAPYPALGLPNAVTSLFVQIRDEPMSRNMLDCHGRITVGTYWQFFKELGRRVVAEPSPNVSESRSVFRRVVLILFRCYPQQVKGRYLRNAALLFRQPRSNQPVE